jgi:hypothetical protein
MGPIGRRDGAAADAADTSARIIRDSHAKLEGVDTRRMNVRKSSGRCSNFFGAKWSPRSLRLPQDFDQQLYDNVYEKLRLRHSAEATWREAASAWVALRYRFLACAEHDNAFTESLDTFGHAPPPHPRYVQEKHLFGFFVTGLSCVECFAYAAYIAASWARPHVFPTATARDLRRINLGTTADGLTREFAGDTLATALQTFADSTDLDEWATVRHVLTHRAHPGRSFSTSIPPVPQDSEAGWFGGVTINHTTTRDRRAWLAGSLHTLMTAAGEFRGFKTLSVARANRCRDNSTTNAPCRFSGGHRSRTGLTALRRATTGIPRENAGIREKG